MTFFMSRNAIQDYFEIFTPYFLLNILLFLIYYSHIFLDRLFDNLSIISRLKVYKCFIIYYLNLIFTISATSRFLRMLEIFKIVIARWFFHQCMIVISWLRITKYQETDIDNIRGFKSRDEEISSANIKFRLGESVTSAQVKIGVNKEK